MAHRCFPVNFVKFVRTPIFIEHLLWMLLYLPDIRTASFFQKFRCPGARYSLPRIFNYSTEHFDLPDHYKYPPVCLWRHHFPKKQTSTTKERLSVPGNKSLQRNASVSQEISKFLPEYLTFKIALSLTSRLKSRISQYPSRCDIFLTENSCFYQYASTFNKAVLFLKCVCTVQHTSNYQEKAHHQNTFFYTTVLWLLLHGEITRNNKRSHFWEITR